MPPDKVFCAGSLAKAYHEISAWYGRNTDEIGAKRILVPFSGYNRMASGMCRPDTEMHTCDFQEITRAIIHGVFCATEPFTKVDKPRFLKGKAVNGELGLAGIDERSAGFIDYVANKGSFLDVASVAMAIPGQTSRGRMTDWTGTFEGLWKKFEKVRADCEPYMPVPGKWFHYTGDFFEFVHTKQFTHPFDAIAIDPPRLSGGRDLYSTGPWMRLNRVLNGTSRIYSWTEDNYFRMLKEVFLVPSKYVLFTWTESTRVEDWPTVVEIKSFLQQFGTIETEDTWDMYNQKQHYGWRLNRGTA